MCLMVYHWFSTAIPEVLGRYPRAYHDVRVNVHHATRPRREQGDHTSIYYKLVYYNTEYTIKYFPLHHQIIIRTSDCYIVYLVLNCFASLSSDRTPFDTQYWPRGIHIL